jgi:hypothetical protein
MSVGTTRHLPLGITTDDRRGVIRRRWRTLATIVAMCLIATAGFLVAEKGYELLAAKQAYVPAAESSPPAVRTPAEAPGAPAVTEPAPAAAEPPAMSIPAPMSPNASKLVSEPAATPETYFASCCRA